MAIRKAPHPELSEGKRSKDGPNGSVESSTAPPPSLAEAIFVYWPMEVLGWSMLCAVVLNLANIIDRYVFRHAISWAGEILIVWLIWCVFIGVAIVTYRGEHLAMDIVSKNLPPRWRRANNLVMTAVFAACLVFAIVQSARVVWLMIETGQTDPMIGLPLWVPNLAILAGFAGSLCALLVRAKSYITGQF